MSVHKYRTSSGVIKTLGVVLSAFYIILLLINYNSVTSKNGLLEAIAIFVMLIVSIMFAISRSYIQIDDSSKTIMYTNWPIKSASVPIGKIIQIGYPKQNVVVESLNPFIYVWYDDPASSGKDKYIKIKNSQFDPSTLATAVTNLKRINPEIKLDPKIQELLGKN